MSAQNKRVFDFRKTKKYWVWFFPNVLFFGCSSLIVNHSPFWESNVVDSVEIKVRPYMFDGAYYKVAFDTVNDKFENMRYVGTENDGHVFMVFLKAVPKGAIFRLVLSDSQCHVSDSRNIEEEHSRYGNDYRSPVNWYGKCVVFDDSVTANFRKRWKPGKESDKQWIRIWSEAIEESKGQHLADSVTAVPASGNPDSLE